MQQDIIQLLPEALANQIAAGEVVQRPASAVKELLENAIDAKASRIQLIVKDAGRTLIQVIDDGSGMSFADALKCFGRHATSKISTSNDLFNIRTFGFRGEALASIAAVAQVELRTRRASDEVGARVAIAGSELMAHEPEACAVGTVITVKNLFFNVPARRNFLKSNPVELKYIVEEFERVALCNPEVAMSMHHNEQETFNLPPSNLAKRIVNLFGKQFQDKIMATQEEVQQFRVWGYVGKPEIAKKTRGEQFFFANGRFIRHHYLHHAVMTAYEGLAPEGHFPFYLLNIELDPKQIDVNVHPTKTEVKFEDERTLYALIRAAVKKTLANYGALPPLDFDFDVNFGQFDKAMEMPKRDLPAPPSRGGAGLSFTPSDVDSHRERSNLKNWQTLFPEGDRPLASPGQWQLPKDFDSIPMLDNSPAGSQEVIFSSAANEGIAPKPLEEKAVMQIRNRYVLSQVKSGLMALDQEAAMERILYERFSQASQSPAASQRLLFPKSVGLSGADFVLAEAYQSELRQLGLDYEIFGKQAVVINGVPLDADGIDEQELLHSVLEQLKTTEDAQFDHQERLARAMAKRLCKAHIKPLSKEEIHSLIEQLFACTQPNYSPSGRKTMAMMSMEQLSQWFV